MHTIILRGEYQRELAKEFIAKAPEGAVVRISKPLRSLGQNAKMWSLLTDVSRAKPNGLHYTPDVWKSLFMNACGHEVQFQIGLDGSPFPAGFKTSRLSTAEMSELIEFIYAWGSENGVIFME